MSYLARCRQCNSDNLRPVEDPPKDNTSVVCENCGTTVGPYKQIMDALAKEAQGDLEKMLKKRGFK